ncbi:hypothetical protein Rpal_3366 [Rhodopseudomonas palustris TIE-1]|uniref:hypothetical protein n=1 Tax=Rhodopseudomonas palustris TaxID=1076 RepID=UPI0001779776|nr:hypothetical protein [Rhodopseudomonas palustris]ACF01868.1 hypothetical protein Rpal_3366 [Rhodopseudomonas palustris TIE-1]
MSITNEHSQQKDLDAWILDSAEIRLADGCHAVCILVDQRTGRTLTTVNDPDAVEDDFETLVLIASADWSETSASPYPPIVMDNSRVHARLSALGLALQMTSPHQGARRSLAERRLNALLLGVDVSITTSDELREILRRRGSEIAV